MTRRTWVRLDNASNIFLAARSDVDSKVFRLSAEMDADVDPALLQEALDATYDRYPLYHSVLRRGVFWYYLQDSGLRPTVEPERLPTCAPIYQVDQRTLLFRVVHHRRRIVLEVFHALSDGTGGLWFLTDLLVEYARRRYPEDAAEVDGTDGAVEAATSNAHPTTESMSGPPESSSAPAETHPAYDLVPDSFAHYFPRRRGRPTPFAGAFARAAAPAALSIEAESSEVEREATEQAGAERSGDDPTADADGDHPATSSPADSPSRSRVHRIRGTRTPDGRTRAVELTMPTSEVIALAKAAGASPTMYLTALFLDAVRESSHGLGRARTLSASVPVNLRQFFPSTSARNFFATIRVEHTFGEGDDSPEAIGRGLEAAFRPQASARALAPKVARFIRVERSPLLRIVPRPLKDLILGRVNALSNRSLTVAVSNLGRVVLPEPAESHVGRILFHVSAVRPQFCAISHGQHFALTFTSPFTRTAHVRAFARALVARGIPVQVTAARVTEEELQEVAR